MLKTFGFLSVFLIICLRAFDSESLIQKIKTPSTSLSEIVSEFPKGAMNGFITIEEGFRFLEKCVIEFPDLIFSRVIGNTTEGQNLTIFGLTNLESNKDNIETLPSILFTGMHHAREPLSYMMNLYVIVNCLYSHQRNDAKIKKVFNQSVLWFLPIVNLDGYRKIIDDFKQRGTLNEEIRKNRRRGSNCDDDRLGVDLNRNYDYEFGFDEQGSSSSPCSEDYRGPYVRFGNAAKTISYVANGEASDWFLGKMGIFSISPELGDDRQASNTFYPPKSEILPILENCFPPIDFLIQKMMFSPKAMLSHETTVPPLSLSSQEESSILPIEIQLYNEALVDLTVKEVKLYLKTSHNQNLPLNDFGMLYSVSNEDQETAANERFDTTLNFLARSYLNLTVLLSKKDLEDIENKYLLQNVLVLKLNNEKEILIKDVDYLKLKSSIKENNKGSSNDWAWFLVSLSILLIFIIVISVGVIIAKRKRNFFERLKISADKGSKALPGFDSEPKRGYSDFNPENEI